MSFKGTKQFGRPAPGIKKWQQPPGTIFYRAVKNNRGRVNALRQDQFSNSGEQFVRIKTSGAVTYTPENTVLIVDQITGRHATTNWNVGAPDYKIFQRVLITGMLPDNDPTEEVQVFESPDCVNPNIATSSLAPPILTYDPGYGFGPDITIDNRYQNPPTVTTNCITDFDTIFRLLVPKDMITRGPEGWTGGTYEVLGET